MAYETSDLYKEAIDSLSRVTFIDGDISTPNGEVIQITNDIIDQGSCYITNQCVSGDAFAYGSVFAAEAGITLKTEINRYSLYDSPIQLFFNILLSNNEYERIPLGKFFVNNPQRIGNSISIKAYDNMVNLDAEIEESTTGTPFELLTLMSSKFNFELSQTQAEIEALVNGDKQLSVDKTLIDTYRDLLSYIGLATCTFAHFDRYGKLRLSVYSNEVTRKIQAKQRTASSFSDFETFYSSVTARFLVNGSYTTYLHTEETSGLLYDMGEVPIIQGTEETNQTALDLIYSQLGTVKYTPCDITFNGDPSIDLGDKIVNIDRFGNEITSLVTYYKWSYRGRHQIKSAGSNPKLANMKEKTSKEIAKLQTEVSKKSIPVYTYTNASSYKVKSEEKVIVDLNFSANDDTSAIFMTTVNFEMDLDGVVEFSTYFDNVLFDNSTIKQYCSKGNNIITFINYIPCEKNHRYGLAVKAKTYYEESDVRVNEAKIATNENARDAVIISYENIVSALKSASAVPITSLSETISYDIVSPSTIEPTMGIEMYNIKSIVFAQGLSGKSEWDGTIAFNEEFGADIPLISNMSVIRFGDNLSVNAQIPAPASITEMFGEIALNGAMSIIGFTDSVSTSHVIISHVFDTTNGVYNSDYVTADGAYMMKTEYKYSSTEQTIDSGKMCSVSIDYTGLTVESVVVENG